MATGLGFMTQSKDHLYKATNDQVNEKIDQ